MPKELIYREEEISKISNTFAAAADNPDKFPLTILQVVGPAGLGKTSSTFRASSIIEKALSEHHLTLLTVYINLKLQGGNKFAIYRLMLERVAPELPSQGLSAEEMLRQMLRYLREKNRYALIILDEIDYLIKTTKDSSMIYDLTRLNEFDLGVSCNVIGVIFVARSTEFYSRLDAAELSSLGRIPLEFHPYTVSQISDILEQRCAEAFQPNAIGSNVIDKVSEITSSPQVGGDVRYALDLLLQAGNIAESNGEGRVTIDHIRKAHSQANPSITSEDIETLSQSQIVTLTGVVRALKTKKKAYAPLKEIRAFVDEIVLQSGLRRFDLEECLEDLHLRQIIDIKSLREIGLHGASLGDIEPILSRRIKAVANERA
jgi:cell division control protein 6